MKKTLLRFIGLFTALFVLHGAAALEIDITDYDRVLVPRGHGKIIDLSEPFGVPNRYPSHNQGMQFMLFFDQGANTGLYVQTTDPQASVTDWDIVTVGTRRKLRITFYKTPEPDVVQDRIDIDPAKPWLAAAEQYKAWAFQQFWAKRKISKFDSVKIVGLGASPYFDWMMHPVAGDIAKFLNAFDNSGAPADSPATAVWLTQWRSDAFNVGFPRYTAAAPSNGRSFEMVLQGLHGRGSIPLPYVNAQLWDNEMANPDEFPAHARSLDHLVKNASGNPIIYNSIWNKLEYACPSVQVWHDIILHARNNKMNDADGVKSQGIYYDMIGSAHPQFCFDINHDHSYGHDPDIWVAKYREMLENTEGVVMVEGSAEVYLDLADVFLMHQETESVNSTGPQRMVPLWNAVYGSISRTAGWLVDVPETDQANILAALKTARSFGSRTWGSPWLGINSNDDAMIFQRRLRSGNYPTVMNMITASPQVLEDGAQGISRWQTTGNVTNVFDTDYGKNVIQLTGTGIAYTAPDWSHTGTNARWSVKRTNPDDMITGFKVTTVSGKTVFLYYNDWLATTPPSMTHATHYYVYHGIGIAPAANGWQTIDRDLEADLRNVLPAETIAQVRSFLMFNNPGRVADVKLFPRLP